MCKRAYSPDSYLLSLLNMEQQQGPQSGVYERRCCNDEQAREATVDCNGALSAFRFLSCISDGCALRSSWCAKNKGNATVGRAMRNARLNAEGTFSIRPTQGAWGGSIHSTQTFEGAMTNELHTGRCISAVCMRVSEHITSYSASSSLHLTVHLMNYSQSCNRGMAS